MDPQSRPPLKVVPGPGTPGDTTGHPEGAHAHEHDTDRTWMDRFLHLSMLNVYGLHGQMSRRVRADVAFAGVLILIQACIDLLAWFLGMRLVFVGGFGPWVGTPLALAFAGLFAATIAIFERSVLTADVDMRGLMKNPAIWFRMTFVLLASLVTAVPLELFLFHDEIGGVIGAERQARIQQAQGVLRQNVDGLVVALDGKLDKDLQRVDQQYAPLRDYVAPTVTSVSPRLDALEAQIAAVTASMQAEDEGKRSGAHGRGRRYKSLQGQMETLIAQRDALLKPHGEELAVLRAEARSRAEAGEKAHAEATATLRSAHEKERAALLAQRAAIEELPVAELARRARVSLDVPDGFAARVKILHAIAEREPTIEWGIWGLRLVMVLFGLLVLIQKATFSTETRAYFSAVARAAQGDPRLQSLFGGLLKLQDWSDKQRRDMSAVTSKPPDEP